VCGTVRQGLVWIIFNTKSVIIYSKIMQFAVSLLLLFIVLMFSGSMLPPIIDAVVSPDTDMGTAANPLKLLVPLIIIVVLLISVVKLTQER